MHFCAEVTGPPSTFHVPQVARYRTGHPSHLAWWQHIGVGDFDLVKELSVSSGQHLPCARPWGHRAEGR